MNSTPSKAAVGEKPAAVPAVVTGVQLMQGLGVQESKGFWAEAWGQVVSRPRAVIALAWIALVGFFAVFAPLLASGHPLWMRSQLPDGTWRATSPLVEHLSDVDWLLIGAALAGVPFVWAPQRVVKLTRAHRLGLIMAAAAQGAVTVLLAHAIKGQVGAREAPEWVRTLQQGAWFPAASAAVCALIAGLAALVVPTFQTRAARLGFIGVVAVVCFAAVWGAWSQRLETFPYRDMERAGRVEAVYTVVPFSPSQRSPALKLLPPGASSEPRSGAAGAAVEGASALVREPARFTLGTDSLGQDVLSQLMHACRLSISIGLVSTGIAVTIGVTIGALMGYFGGWVDTVLFRLVEIVMSIPVLFLLIVAAAVLPRNTYVMMAIIGCVTWTGAARYTRAEFMRLRSQDFVQSARAVGLPLRSVLFKHMLPNGVTPVLVDASFAVAAAIQIEATLNFLGLGPAEQPSWGRLLASATNEVGGFLWWLAIFPGLAIFVTVLAYNMLGEALRDAIDPKLKKARV